MSKDPLVRRSKWLSLVLRHEPGSVGLVLGEGGWADVDKLLPAMQLTREQLEEVVARSDKKRFEFDETKTKIRASQGHSVDVDLGYVPTPPPDLLFHGTSKDLIPVIMKTGLLKMERHHVHLSAQYKNAILVAQRRRNPTVLSINSKAMAIDNHKFMISTNGVWLVDSVPPVYLDIVEVAPVE